MKIIRNISEIKEIISTINGTIGFVPTMGALHNGHLSLMQRAKEENDYLICSIFVNPTQFGENEDFDKYPKQEKADIQLAQDIGVDILFMPNINDMYEDDEISIKAPKLRGFVLEGFQRPNHFDGVLQIVLKLFNLILPTKAYFGKKDAQQLNMIEIMVKNLFLNVEIVPCEIVRDKDGLALSSRNVYLTSSQRATALSIPKSIFYAKDLIENGERDIEKIKDKMKDILKDTDIEYIEIVDRQFNLLLEVEIGNTIILVVTKIGYTRLLDNLYI